MWMPAKHSTRLIFFLINKPMFGNPIKVIPNQVIFILFLSTIP